MNLLDLVSRANRPRPWTEGDNIPWNDPDFSRRMLKVHLSQDNDWASRRFPIIDGHVSWIHQHVLGGKPSRVLDLGCGPGLYTTRLARLGHDCTGIDFSPASVEYATATAEQEGLAARHVLGDVRETPFGRDYDLVMMIFGEFNVFEPRTAAALLRRAHAALKPGGRLLLEVSEHQAIKAMGKEPDTWSTSRSGLFSDRPHLYLEEHDWDEEIGAATIRHWIVDAASGELTRYTVSYAGHTEQGLVGLAEEAAFRNVQVLPGLGGAPKQEGFVAVVAEA